MTKLDWQMRENWSQGERVSGKGRTVPSPFLAQGVRDALRNAYVEPGEDMPAEFTSLLERIQ